MVARKKTEQQEQIQVDAASKICARTFEIISIAGIVFLIIGLVLYVTGVIPPFVPMSMMENYWKYKPSVFWQKVSEKLHVTIRLGSYLWIFDHINHSDMIAMIGVLIFVVGVIVSIIGICVAYAIKKDTRILIVSLIVLAITLYAILKYI